jgi:hypothetical protein
MNARVAKIEQLRIENKFGKVVRLLGDEEYTCGEDGKICTTPASVANVFDKFFGNWFQVPDNLDPAVLTIEKSPTLWQELAHPPPDIQKAMDSSLLSTQTPRFQKTFRMACGGHVPAKPRFLPSVKACRSS